MLFLFYFYLRFKNLVGKSEEKNLKVLKMRDKRVSGNTNFFIMLNTEVGGGISKLQITSL